MIESNRNDVINKLSANLFDDNIVGTKGSNKVERGTKLANEVLKIFKKCPLSNWWVQFMQIVSGQMSDLCVIRETSRTHFTMIHAHNYRNGVARPRERRVPSSLIISLYNYLLVIKYIINNMKSCQTTNKNYGKNNLNGEWWQIIVLFLKNIF